jgi:hypothetical protein
MLATCNSIFEGMDPRAVAELFRYEEQLGFYRVTRPLPFTAFVVGALSAPRGL